MGLEMGVNVQVKGVCGAADPTVKIPVPQTGVLVLHPNMEGAERRQGADSG